MAAVADKPAKTGSRSSTKVFDVSKPNKQSATATSRPVIVTNRPIMQDPMMNSGMSTGISDEALNDAEITAKAEAKPEISPSSVKMTVQPLSSPDSSSETTAKETPKKDALKSEPDSASDYNDIFKIDSKDTAKEEPTKEPEVEPTAEPAETEVTDTPADDTSDALPGVDQPKDEKETAALEAAAKQQAELDTLVESKEYFLPINAVERRRSKLVTLLGVLLIVALSLLLVNLLMDVGYLRIPGVQPLTHFFSA